MFSPSAVVFSPQSASQSCHFSEDTDVWQLLISSRTQLEERLLTVSAERLCNIRNKETNVISFICLLWERKAVAHETKCVHRVFCATQPWKLGQLHLFLMSQGARELRPPFWQEVVRAEAIFLVKTAFLEHWTPINCRDRWELSLWQNGLQKECGVCLFHKFQCNINRRTHYFFLVIQ